MLEIIDTHSHLTDKEFEDESFNNSFFEAEGFKVCRVISVAYDKESIGEVLQLVQKHTNIYGEIGIHPDDAECFDEIIEKILLQEKENQKIVAIGEIGLDYHSKDNSSNYKEKQKEIFIKQLKIANQLKLPVVIHTRDAIADTLKILKENIKLINNGCVIHCFSESLEIYKEIEKLGFAISVGGVLTFKNAKNLLEVIKYANINNILLETDCPYLTPEPFRGKCKNSPIMARFVAMKIAELKGLTVEEVCKITTNNALRIFNKIK